MAIIIRVKELIHETDPESEFPVPVMRTKGIYKVPNEFDYGAVCDDRTNVEVIAENVPDDAIMGTWELPIPKLVLKDEGELADIILRNIHLLTCYNCGRALEGVHSKHKGRAEDLGMLCIDPGSNNYPREPDEPVQAYFECMECREANDR
jgi:hypothetical protein